MLAFQLLLVPRMIVAMAMMTRIPMLLLLNDDGHGDGDSGGAGIMATSYRNKTGPPYHIKSSSHEARN